jgi:hypothetical protein
MMRSWSETALHGPGIIMVRGPDTGTALTDFFENAALVWITDGLLLFSGLLIIAHHQYWSSVAAILISLLGWYLTLRGVVWCCLARRN